MSSKNYNYNNTSSEKKKYEDKLKKATADYMHILNNMSVNNNSIYTDNYSRNYNINCNSYNNTNNVVISVRNSNGEYSP
jgi:hypothetical protein